MESSDRKQTYVAATTFKLKPRRSTSTPDRRRDESERVAFRRYRSSSVMLENAGRSVGVRTTTPGVRARGTHVSSVSISLGRGTTGRATSEPRDGGSSYSAEPVANYRLVSGQIASKHLENVAASNDVVKIDKLEVGSVVKEPNRVNKQRADDGDGRCGFDDSEAIVDEEAGRPAAFQRTVVVSRKRVDVDISSGDLRRTVSESNVGLTATMASGSSPEDEDESEFRRRDVRSDIVVSSGESQTSCRCVNESCESVVVRSECGDEESPDIDDSVLGKRRSSSSNYDVISNLCEDTGFGEEMMHTYHTLEAALLNEKGSGVNDNEKGIGDIVTRLDQKTDEFAVAVPSVPVSDVDDSDRDGMHRLGSANQNAPDVHLYNDQKGRLHVVVDASKFSSTLSPNIVSGMKATVGNANDVDMLNDEEMSDLTHVMLRRRSSMYQAMENSVMPKARRAALQNREKQKTAEEQCGSPQLMPLMFPKRLQQIRRTQSVEFLPLNSRDARQLSPFLHLRSRSDRRHRRPLSAIHSADEVDSLALTLNEKPTAIYPQVYINDFNNSQQKSLTITIPGGATVTLRPPVKSKDDMTDDDMRQHVLVNLIETEVSYVRSLQTLIKVYFEPLKRPRTPTLIDASLVDEIFYQIPNLQSCHELFLRQLMDRVSEWHNQQKIGDIFVNQFSKCMLSDAYAAFINHYLQAKEAVRTAAIQRPAFSKFLELCSREHSDKLTLNDLLIQPVQRIPRYVLLLKDMLKHTSHDHPDHNHLLSAISELTTLAEKMDQGEWEAAEAEKLRELEATFEGHVSFAAPKRYVLCQDKVQQVMEDEQVKDRLLVMLSDFVICAAIRRPRSSTFKRRGSARFSLALLPSTSMYEIKHKLLWKATFSDVILVKSLEALVPTPYTSLILPPSLTASVNRRTSFGEKTTVEKLQHDSACLQQIAGLVKQLYIHHAQLDVAIRELDTDVKEQIEIQKQTELQLSLVKARLGVILHNNNGDPMTYTFQFASEQRKKEWIDEFEEAKKKFFAAEDSNVTWNPPATTASYLSNFDKARANSEHELFIPPEPQFYKPIPLMKTRSGMRISCAATSISPALSHHGSLGSGNLWICASDGCVGQVGIVTVDGAAPHEMVCITVCACQITCIVPVPDMTNERERRESTIGILRQTANKEPVQRSFSNSSDVVRERSRASALIKRSHSFGDRARSSSQPTLTMGVNTENHSLRFFSLSSASSMRLYSHRQGDTNQLLEHLSSLPGPESEACLYPESNVSDLRSQSSVDISTIRESLGIQQAEMAPPDSSPVSSLSSTSSTPSNSPATALGHGRLVRGGSPVDGRCMHTEIPEEGESHVSSSLSSDLCCLKVPTMWLGTEEGSVLVYHASDSIRVRQKRTKIEFGSPVVTMSYLKNRVFVSLKNGVVYAVSRADDGCWDIQSREQVLVGSGDVPITCMKSVLDYMWCSSRNVVHIVSPLSLQTERHFQAHNDQSKTVTHISAAGLTAWIAFEKSPEVKLFNAVTLQVLAVVDVRSEVKRILQGSNGIVRQHKISQLRVTCLQPCEGLLWIGTSAGAMLTMRMPVIEEDTSSVLDLPTLSSSYLGHSGVVRFVTALRKQTAVDDEHADSDFVRSLADRGSTDSLPQSVSHTRLSRMKKDTTDEFLSANRRMHNRTSSDVSTISDCTIFSESEPPAESQIIVVSGGDGFEDFRTSADDQVVGRDDSTSHILTWLV